MLSWLLSPPLAATYGPYFFTSPTLLNGSSCVIAMHAALDHNERQSPFTHTGASVMRQVDSWEGRLFVLNVQPLQALNKMLQNSVILADQSPNGKHRVCSTPFVPDMLYFAKA